MSLNVCEWLFCLCLSVGKTFFFTLFTTKSLIWGGEVERYDKRESGKEREGGKECRLCLNYTLRISEIYTACFLDISSLIFCNVCRERCRHCSTGSISGCPGTDCNSDCRTRGVCEETKVGRSHRWLTVTRRE